MKKQICIMGTGGFAREVLCLIADLGKYEEVDCFMESNEAWETEWKGKSIMGKPVKPQSEFNPSKSVATIGVGDTKIRQKIANSLPENTEYITLVHPTAVVSRWVEIGKGAIICAGSILTCNIKIGKHAHFNLQTTVGHDCNIGDFVTTAPSVNISGICNIGHHVYFGTGAGVRQGINICDNVTIGMGAMVVKNIEEAGTYVGMPAINLAKLKKK